MVSTKINTKEELAGEIRNMVVQGMISDMVQCEIPITTANVVDMAMETIEAEVEIADELYEKKTIKYLKKQMEYYT